MVGVQYVTLGKIRTLSMLYAYMMDIGWACVICSGLALLEVMIEF